MADIREDLANLISSLSAPNFRELIKAFLKAKYKTEDIFITDGPYDGGNDLEIRLKDRTIKRNIQVTVQKLDIESKLKTDLQSALENVKDHKYLDQMDFFCSESITRSKEEKWKTMAETDFQINLTIYDSNILSQLNEEYPIIREKVFELFGYKTDEPLLKVNEESKILFDVLSLGKETGEIKKQFINAYIFSYLYVNPGSTIEKIMEGVKLQLPDLTDIKLYRDNLSAAKGQGHLITIADDTKKLYSLSPEKTTEIKSLYEGNELKEAILNESIQHILKKYNIGEYAGDVAQFLLGAYKVNYEIELDELAGKSYSIETSIRKIYEDLEKFVKALGVPEKDTENLRNELFELCRENEYLNKIGASILFANLYKSNRLEDYLNTKIQYYYFDTQVLLRLICYQYHPANDYDDVYFHRLKNSMIL